MYEKKRKLNQPAAILMKINVQLSDAVHRNMNKKCAIFR